MANQRLYCSECRSWISRGSYVYEQAESRLCKRCGEQASRLLNPRSLWRALTKGTAKGPFVYAPPVPPEPEVKLDPPRKFAPISERKPVSIRLDLPESKPSLSVEFRDCNPDGGFPRWEARVVLDGRPMRMLASSNESSLGNSLNSYHGSTSPPDIAEWFEAGTLKSLLESKRMQTRLEGSVFVATGSESSSSPHGDSRSSCELQLDLRTHTGSIHQSSDIDVSD